MTSGKVIRGASSLEPAARVVSAGAYEAQARARVEAAQAEAEQLRQAARDAGRQEGRAEAVALLARVRGERAERLAAAQEDAVVLAVRIAERLLGQALARDPALEAALCGQVLAGLRQEGALVVRVHPEALAVLGAQPFGPDVAVRADPDVERHGCVVETGWGEADGQLHVQLAALERALRAEAAR